jgi:RNA polymerase sigma-70 factor (ECF subfamily)
MISDAQLIKQVLKGRQSAYETLVDRYRDYVFSVVLRIVKTREEAEETTMDVFLKAYESLGSFEQKSRFSTWLYTIAYRTAIDRVRKKKPYTRSLDEDEKPFQLAEASDRTPDQKLQQKDLGDTIELALDRLKPEDAALIRLFYLQENSVKEVAEITELSVSNVKVKLYRLRSELKEIIQHLYSNEITDWI